MADLIKSIKLASSENGVISLSHMSEAYGEGSSDVVSIGISLKGDSENPEWKAHIPYENIDEVIQALKEAKTKHSK